MAEFLTRIFFLWVIITVPVSARDWGFDRDSVFERGLDSVHVLNGGADTLYLGALFVEPVSPVTDSFGIVFFPPSPQAFYTWNSTYPANPPVNVKVAPGKTATFRSFQIERAGTPWLAKVTRSSGPAIGDTLILRLRFTAADQEDTLMLKGIVNGSWTPTPVKPKPDGMKPSPSIGSKPRDIRGRLAKPSENVPALPLFQTP